MAKKAKTTRKASYEKPKAEALNDSELDSVVGGKGGRTPRGPSTKGCFTGATAKASCGSGGYAVDSCTSGSNDENS